MVKHMRAAEIIELIEEAWRKLENLTDAEAIAFIEEFPEQHPFFVQRRIVREAPVQEIVKALLSAKYPKLQNHLIYILGKRRARSTANAILPFLTDDDPEIRNSAVDALAAIGDPRVGETLMQRFVTGETDEGVRAMLAFALGAVRYRDAIPVLIDSLTSTDPGLRGATAWSLGHLKAREAYNSLQEALGQETVPYARKRIQGALNEIRGMDDLQ